MDDRPTTNHHAAKKYASFIYFLHSFSCITHEDWFPYHELKRYIKQLNINTCIDKSFKHNCFISFENECLYLKYIEKYLKFNSKLNFNGIIINKIFGWGWVQKILYNMYFKPT